MTVASGLFKSWLVAILSGGGGDVGLSCYNNYKLSEAIANFPLPVITGIGHATNETVVEMISFQNAITPTKLAEYLIQNFHNFAVPVNKAIETVSNKSKLLILDQKNKLQQTSRYFRSVSQNILISNKSTINQIAKMIGTGTKVLFNFKVNNINYSKEKLVKSLAHFQYNIVLELNNIEKYIAVLNPVNVLKRGYSITMLNGKVLKNSSEAEKNDTLKTILYDGTITSKVTSTAKKQKE